MAETIDSEKLANQKIVSYRFKNLIRTAVILSIGAGAMWWYLKKYKTT